MGVKNPVSLHSELRGMPGFSLRVVGVGGTNNTNPYIANGEFEVIFVHSFWVSIEHRNVLMFNTG